MADQENRRAGKRKQVASVTQFYWRNIRYGDKHSLQHNQQNQKTNIWWWENVQDVQWKTRLHLSHETQAAYWTLYHSR